MFRITILQSKVSTIGYQRSPKVTIQIEITLVTNVFKQVIVFQDEKNVFFIGIGNVEFKRECSGHQNIRIKYTEYTI